MEATEKLKEIEGLIVELKKLENHLYTPIERFRKLRKEISSSVDFLRGLQKSIRRANKKNHDLTVKMASGMETTDSKILDKFFERVIAALNETRQEIEEKWATLKELKEEDSAANQTEESDIS